MSMRLTIVQYGGNYREAFERFAAGGKSTYHAQRYSVDFVGSLAQHFEQVAVLCAVCDEPYDVVLPNKVRAIGAGLKPGFHPSQLLPFLTRTQPNRLFLTTPMVPLLRWARRERVRTMTALADSFASTGLVAKVRQWVLAHELNRPNVEWVGNHGIGACLSLEEIGVRSEKVIPWDWPRMHVPYDYAPRTIPQGQPEFNLAYVGTVSEAKGVGDLLRALRLLDGVKLTIFGSPSDEMRQLAQGLDVHFAGLVPNEEIPLAMRQADAVVVPSRHEYGEGLPGTIYQALAARTPIIASDHPMFRGALVHDRSAIIFPARDEAALAASIRRLANSPRLYAALSLNSLEAWEALQLPVKWGQLLEHWLSEEPGDTEWLLGNRLHSGQYDRQIAARQAA